MAGMQAAIRGVVAVLGMLTVWGADGAPARAEVPTRDKLVRAIQDVLQGSRKLDGVVSAGDGNMYIQCYRRAGWRRIRCETAGLEGQPWLRHQLTVDRQEWLIGQGFLPDATTGNFVRRLEALPSPPALADLMIRTLAAGYGREESALWVESVWWPHKGCLPRIPAGHNDGGAIPIWQWEMKAAVGNCALHSIEAMPSPPSPPLAPPANPDAKKLQEKETMRRGLAWVAKATAEVHHFAIFEWKPGVVYVQCLSEGDDQLYCEAVSADAIPQVRAIVTPEREAQLLALGFQKPGLSMNYTQALPLAQATTGEAADLMMRAAAAAYGDYLNGELHLKTHPQMPSTSEAGDGLAD